MRNILGYFLLFLGLILVGYVVFINTSLGKTTHTFSNYSFLNSTWDKYKTQFINSDGRVIDYSQSAVTTSEGQSYAMLRAVWADDRETFDKVWNFTNNNMKRKSDNLYGWRWGKKTDGSYGFLSISDQNSATDADEDIAFALILAARRWNTQSYQDSAKAILLDLWKYDTGVASSNRYITAGNWANEGSRLIINPSYFAPYEYRVFATVDTEDNWNSLIDPGYALLTDVGKAKLDTTSVANLPPNWVAMNKITGQFSAADVQNATTDYSYDAMRTPWRVALDYQWNQSKEAYNYLHTYSYLVNYYLQHKKLASDYLHDGSIKNNTESPAMYGTAIGFLLYDSPKLAQSDYQNKILSLYSNTTNAFNKNLPYYDQNWVWFGAALYDKQLSNFQ